MSTINDQPSAIDRCGELRTHPDTLEALWNQSRVLHFSDGYISADSDSLRFLRAKDCTALIGSDGFSIGEKYFLGKDATTGQSYFAWNSKRTTGEKIEENRTGYSTLRELGPTLSPLDLEVALHTVALANWHNSHPHCARCGAATTVDLGGAVRVCAKDSSQHHPRTDSAVIVLLRDKDDRILLGHQPVWPEGRFSCFAGFLEPGETFEQCVSREVYEESGVTLSKISYLGSQPWPFPASIMIAFDAIVEDPSAARPDGEEITEVKWFSRAELKEQAAAGTVLLPPTFSVAHKMISRWFAEADSSPLVGKTVGR
jgi:NAD+ diphosphatase